MSGPIAIQCNGCCELLPGTFPSVPEADSAALEEGWLIEWSPCMDAGAETAYEITHDTDGESVFYRGEHFCPTCRVKLGKVAA